MPMILESNESMARLITLSLGPTACPMQDPTWETFLSLKPHNPTGHSVQIRCGLCGETVGEGISSEWTQKEYTCGYK